MILSDLRTRILYSIGAGDAGDVYDNDIKYALERVQDEITAEINFTELLKLDTTTIRLEEDTQSYNLPSDFWKLIVAWNSQDYDNELQRISPAEYKTYLPDIDTYQAIPPIYYDLLDNTSSGTAYYRKIYFFPYPDTILDGAITTFTDYGATVTGTVEITDADHELATGDSITISGTTNYDGVYTVTKIDDDNFYITATYVAEVGGATKVWEKNYYVPFVYMRKPAYLSADSDENVLSELYPNLLIEGASFYLYRDKIYRDSPEKIAFRREEWGKQKELVKRIQRSPDKLSKVLPKRLLPTITRKLYTVQTFG